jgi:hypothetical protein
MTDHRYLALYTGDAVHLGSTLRGDRTYCGKLVRRPARGPDLTGITCRACLRTGDYRRAEKGMTP